MSARYLIVVLSALSFIGCGGSGGNDNDSENDEGATWEELDNTFSDIESYEKSSFTLSADVDYWSIVRNETRISEEPSLHISYSFDEEDYSSLSEPKKDEIDTSFSSSGFTRGGCLPEHCPYYVISLGTEGAVTIVDSDISLAEFFVPIDTDAELHVYLWARNYEPTSFQSVDGGYQVIADLTTCESATTNLLFVDHNGVITVEEERDQEVEDPPICS